MMSQNKADSAVQLHVCIAAHWNSSPTMSPHNEVCRTAPHSLCGTPLSADACTPIIQATSLPQETPREGQMQLQARPLSADRRFHCNQMCQMCCRSSTP
jgi:hypothetical protein